MRKLLFVAAGLASLSGAALAHDIFTPHASRGDCERALAQINNDDRKYWKETFDENAGESNKFLHEHFECQQRGESWYITRVNF